MRISDWSSDVCSAQFLSEGIPDKTSIQILQWMSPRIADRMVQWFVPRQMAKGVYERIAQHRADYLEQGVWSSLSSDAPRSEEHTSELQSLMRISYAVFCLKKKTEHQTPTN